MADPVPTFSHLLREIRARHPRFAFVHLVEGDASAGGMESSLDFARKIWHGGRQPGDEGVFISCENHTRASALKHAAEKGDVVAFGKPFTSNPDLVRRIRDDIPFTPYDPNVFYATVDPKGYVDYPFASDQSPLQNQVSPSHSAHL